MKIGEKIKTLRKENKMSQEFLAEKMNISRQAVSKRESGQSEPTASNIRLLAEIFEVSPSELFSDQKDLKDIEKKEDLHKKNGGESWGELFLRIVIDIVLTIFGFLFFFAYREMIMIEGLGLDPTKLPWIFLTIYFIFAIPALILAYHYTEEIMEDKNVGYFTFSKLLLPLLYILAPIIVVIKILKSIK